MASEVGQHKCRQDWSRRLFAVCACLNGYNIPSLNADVTLVAKFGGSGHHQLVATSSALSPRRVRPAVHKTAARARPDKNKNGEGGLANTPHAAFHYDDTTSRRAFEGWYLRLTLPDERSFAFIHAVEDPNGESPLSKVTSQVMWSGTSGSENEEEEGYIMQHTRDVGSFWADKEKMAFGASYSSNKKSSNGTSNGNGSSGSNGAAQTTECKANIMNEKEFFEAVNCGFQANDVLHTGSLVPTEPEGDMLQSVLPSATAPENTGAQKLKWAYSIKPLYTWGAAATSEPEKAADGLLDNETNGNHNNGRVSEAAELPNGKTVEGKATTGWLALSPIFDPQWQICIAHAAATGWIEIDGKRTEFDGASAYVEKNWGTSFPPKWFWMQCNSFEGQADLTVTAVGARRRAVEPASGFVDVGVIGVHHETQNQHTRDNTTYFNSSILISCTLITIWWLFFSKTVGVGLG